LRQLIRRFDEIPPAIEAQIGQLSGDELELLGDAMLGFRSLWDRGLVGAAGVRAIATTNLLVDTS
jgi:hypothetical protein